MQLKPCPFCGGNGELKERPPRVGHSRYWEVYCPECDFLIGSSTMKNCAIEAWNRRAPCDEDRTPQFDAKRMGMR